MKSILKKSVLLLILPVIFLLTVNFVLAATGAICTLDLPITSETIRDNTYNFSATYKNESTLVGVETYNVTFYGNSTSTANSTAVVFMIISNTTQNAEPSGGDVVWNMTMFNQTYNTSVQRSYDESGFEDSNDFEFYVVCASGADTNTSALVTSVTIDNSFTRAPTSLSPSDNTVDTDGSVTFSVTVAGRNTTGCNLKFPKLNPGSKGYVMSHGGDLCNTTLNNIPEQTYDWYVTASDGTNTSDSVHYTATVDIKTSAGKAAVMKAQLGEKAEVRGQHLLAITTETAFDFMEARVLGVPVVVIFILVAAFLIFTYWKKK